MITQTYPSKRPIAVIHPPVVYNNGVYQPNKAPWYTPAEVQQAQMRNITPAEYTRRDDIVRTKYNACPFKMGDTVFPADIKDYHRYGAFIVVGVLASYKDTATDHVWGQSDNPLIITIRSLSEKKEVLFCSSPWLTKTNLHLVTETAV